MAKRSTTNAIVPDSASSVADAGLAISTRELRKRLAAATGDINAMAPDYDPFEQFAPMGQVDPNLDTRPPEDRNAGRFAKANLDVLASKMPLPREAQFSRDLLTKEENPVERSRGQVPGVVDPARVGDVLGVAGKLATAPVNAAGDILQNYRPGAENEVANQDIGRQGTAAAMALSPAAFRAGAGELSATGSQVFRRTDAQAFARKLREQGMSDEKIARELTERFAPELDEGQAVTKSMVGGARYRRDIKELGAMGGSNSAGRRVTAEDVMQWAREAGVEARLADKKSDWTTYVEVVDPANPPRSGREVPTVRFPEDGHVGRPIRDKAIPNTYDTGQGRRLSGQAGAYNKNVSGEPYSDPDVLEAALKWRLSRAPEGDNWLVSPDQTPRGVRHETDPKPQPTPPTAPDKRQLRLLAGSLPVGSAGDTQPTWADQAIRPQVDRYNEMPDLPGIAVQAGREADYITPDELRRGKKLPPGFVLDSENAMLPRQ